MSVKSCEKREKSMVEMTVEVSAADFEAAVEKAYRKQRGKINMPGFRPGKAPRKMIESMYGPEVFYEEAVNIALPDAYMNAVKEQELEVVGYPEVELLEVGKEGFSFKATVAVYPEVTLGQYKGLEAPKAEVITAWGRLGYPRRALRLQECARVVAEDYADKLPRTYDELTALPGIGDYTASAVMSFAFGERIAVIDTNIRRVLSRVFLGVESRGGATSPAERALANRMLPKDEILGCDADVADNAGSAEHVVNSTIRGGKRSRLHRGERPSVTWNQSVMELGAVICTAKSPLCDTCPIADDCAFLKAGRPGLGERRTRPRQRFQGTDRQVRGLVLAALRELPAGATLPREDADKLWKDQIQLAACIASLDDDGLIEILDGGLRLPS